MLRVRQRRRGLWAWRPCKLAEATATAHECHVKAKEMVTLLQQAKASREWASSIVAHNVTRSAFPPQVSGRQWESRLSIRLPSTWPAPKAMTTPFQPRPCTFVPRVGVPQGAHILGVQVHNVQFAATRTRKPRKDFRCARLCSGNERQKGANVPFKYTCACSFFTVVPLVHHSSGTMHYVAKKAGPSPYVGSFSSFRHLRCGGA